MKLYCEPCKGSGKVTHVMSLGEGVRGIGQSRTCQCLQCDGKGYTESPETQRLIELGNAVEKAFEQKSSNFDWYDNYTDHDNNYRCACDPEMLIAWYREQEENG